MYHYAVIKYIKPGTHPEVEVISWYLYNKENDGFESIDFSRREYKSNYSDTFFNK